MSTTENRETPRVAGSDIDGSEREDDVHRVQEGGEQSDANAEIRARAAEDNELFNRGSRQLHAVPSVDPSIEGFLPAVWKPESFQERGAEWLAERPAGALFLPPGMGKTSMSLAARSILQETLQKRIRVLVIAPLTVCLTTWLSEPAKWRQFASLKLGLAHGADKKLILQDDYYDIVILNYDGIEWASELLKYGHNFDVLLCDEITRLKHTTSKRFKLLKPLLPSFAFRWGLTGTPAANGLMDLFGQCYVLDLGKRLGRYITQFRLKYFYQKSWDQYRWFIRPADEKLLTEAISDMAMYLDPKDYLVLPPLIDVPLALELEPSARKKYNDLEQDFIVKLHDGYITAANAGVLTQKLRQYTGGAVYTAPRVSELTGTIAKIERLKDLVEEMAGEPLMVAYQFEHEYERLIKEFPSALAIKGGMSETKLQETVITWNQGNIPVLLVQPTAAALGLNLQFGGHALCWFSLTYNLEEYIQLIARLLRRGQEKPVMNYLLTMKATIDEAIVKVITQKGITQDDLFQGLKVLGTKV